MDRITISILRVSSSMLTRDKNQTHVWCDGLLYLQTLCVNWYVQDTLAQSQDKAFQRMAELREQIQLDHLAKLDIENNYRMLLEDKDEAIKVLKMQVVRVCEAFSVCAVSVY